jgi:hypothetical protein
MPMTAVPQRTALSHAFGALASALIGTASITARHTGFIAWLIVEMLLGFLFTGSLMAFGKLQEIWIPGRSCTGARTLSIWDCWVSRPVGVTRSIRADLDASDFRRDGAIVRAMLIVDRRRGHGHRAAQFLRGTLGERRDSPSITNCSLSPGAGRLVRVHQRDHVPRYEPVIHQRAVAFGQVQAGAVAAEAPGAVCERRRSGRFWNPEAGDCGPRPGLAVAQAQHKPRELYEG